MYQEQRFYKTLIVVLMIIGMLAFLPQIISFVSTTLYTVVGEVIYEPTPTPTDSIVPEVVNTETPSPTEEPDDRSLTDRLNDKENDKYRP